MDNPVIVYGENTLCSIMGLCMMLLYMFQDVMQYIGRLVFILWDSGMNSLGRKRLILDRENKEPYLIRYYVLFKDRSETQSFNIFIHKIIKSDDEESLHDHPWRYFTFILGGGYYETVFNDKNQLVQHWRQPRTYYSYPATHRHKIILKPDIPCWTVFIPFARERDWGFWKKQETMADEDKETMADEDKDTNKDASKNENKDDFTFIQHKTFLKKIE